MASVPADSVRRCSGFRQFNQRDFSDAIVAQPVLESFAVSPPAHCYQLMMAFATIFS